MKAVMAPGWSSTRVTRMTGNACAWWRALVSHLPCRDKVLELVTVGEDKDEWDCESIVSTYSHWENR